MYAFPPNAVVANKLAGRLNVPANVSSLVRTAAPEIELCSYGAPNASPVPVVLNVDAFNSRVASTNLPEGRHALEFIVGTTTSFTANSEQGYLRLEYGAYGGRVVRYMDIRAGSYQLPPVQFVTVRACVYNPNALPSTRPGAVVASLSPGIVPYPQLPTYSGAWAAAAGAQAASFPLAAGAVRWRVGVVTATGALAAVQVVARTGLSTVFIDASLPTYTPQGLLSEALPAGSDNTVLIDKTGADACTVMAQAELVL